MQESSSNHVQVRNITNEEDNAAEVLQNLLEQQELSVESVIMEESSKPGGGKQLLGHRPPCAAHAALAERRR